jgi:hypothetical protein
LIKIIDDCDINLFVTYSFADKSDGSTIECRDTIERDIIAAENPRKVLRIISEEDKLYFLKRLKLE